MNAFRFGTPAFVQDFPQGSEEAEALADLWNARVAGFTQQAIVGNPWNATNEANQDAYYDPTETPIPQGTATARVRWFGYPARLGQYLGTVDPASPYQLSDEQLLQIADSGEGFQQIPKTICPEPQWSKDPADMREYGPYGPRGWLDEYCEWSVTRDGRDRITRIDFTCENPEYWHTLWSVSPDRAAEVYQDALNAGAPAANHVTVTVDDLTLKVGGVAVTDPSTGGPAYNPLNKWNSGTVSLRGSDAATGGAMHLTSTPNTLQTEIGLAAGATVQRKIGNSDPQALICCAPYGQSFRNSDPHIGQSVNVIVAGGARVSLANPVGLYMQQPQFNRWSLPQDPNLPSGASAQDCWQIVRGTADLTDPVTGSPFPGDFILHAAFQLPQAWIDAGVAFTAGDVMVDGVPVKYGGQVTQTIQIALFARPLPAAAPAPQDCVGTPGTVEVQPLQLFHASLWEAYYTTDAPNPMAPMNLASSTVIVPPRVAAGSSAQMALTCVGVAGDGPPTIAFPGADGAVAGQVDGPVDVSYAVPGNSYPSPAQLLTFPLTVDASVPPGVYPITVTNAGGPTGAPAPAFLQVVPAGSIPS